MTRALRPVSAECHAASSCPVPFRLAAARPGGSRVAMGGTVTPRPGSPSLVKPRIQVERPRLHKVILLNDDYTPREFVIMVLKAEFRMSEEQAFAVMMTAHRRGTCVVAVFTRDVAETKATRATDMAKAQGFPLMFSTEPEE